MGFQLRFFPRKQFRLPKTPHAIFNLFICQRHKFSTSIIPHKKKRPADNIEIIQPPIGFHAVELALFITAQDNSIADADWLKKSAAYFLLYIFQRVFDFLFIGPLSTKK